MVERKFYVLNIRVNFTELKVFDGPTMYSDDYIVGQIQAKIAYTYFSFTTVLLFTLPLFLLPISLSFLFSIFPSINHVKHYNYVPETSRHRSFYVYLFPSRRRFSLAVFFSHHLFLTPSFLFSSFSLVLRFLFQLIA